MNVGQEPSSVYATTVPHLAFMIFQAMFAIITVALITGAVVERMKFRLCPCLFCSVADCGLLSGGPLGLG